MDATMLLRGVQGRSLHSPDQNLLFKLEIANSLGSQTCTEEWVMATQPTGVHGGRQ